MTFEELGGWPAVLGRALAGEPLSGVEVQVVLGEVLGGRASPAQMGAWLVALRAKGESLEEMTGLVVGMMAHAEPLELPGDADVIDVVGTGGDRQSSINVSTLAALIATGAGARVCKHGGRAASSSVGTADVLEALGVEVGLGPAGVVRCLSEVGMAFCFSQRYHPAMRFLAPIRRELGVPTIFNFLGPLANPARARRQLVGVSDPSMARHMAEVLGAGGSIRSMVVYADDGLDELSVTSPTTVIDLRGDGEGEFELRKLRVDPQALGLAPATLADLRGGDASYNAAAIRAVLDGERGARRDIGVLNAAGALVVAGLAGDLPEALGAASAAVDDGRAAAVLDGLVAVSQAAARSVAPA
ncbi:MAG TPA: anthranilate phosphoribosyltransferase [Acidimicrobiales bacterium]